MEIACLGQTLTQQPQATQSWLFTNAFRFFLIFVSKIKPPVYVWGKSFKFFISGVSHTRDFPVVLRLSIPETKGQSQ